MSSDDLYYDTLEEFVEEHYGYFLNLFRRRLYDPQDAEDMTQELFMKVWRTQPNLSGCWSYTKQAAHNLLLNYYRDTGTDILWEWPETPVDDDDALIRFPDNTLTPPDQSLQWEEAWQCLTEQQRSILSLIYFQGLTHQEIYRKLNLSKSTVWREKKKAFKKMRRYL